MWLKIHSSHPNSPNRPGIKSRFTTAYQKLTTRVGLTGAATIAWACVDQVHSDRVVCIMSNNVTASRLFGSRIKSGFGPWSYLTIWTRGVYLFPCFDTDFGVLGSLTTSECVSKEFSFASLWDHRLDRLGVHALLCMCNIHCQQAAARFFVPLHMTLGASCPSFVSGPVLLCLQNKKKRPLGAQNLMKNNNSLHFQKREKGFILSTYYH